MFLNVKTQYFIASGWKGEATNQLKDQWSPIGDLFHPKHHKEIESSAQESEVINAVMGVGHVHRSLGETPDSSYLTVGFTSYMQVKKKVKFSFLQRKNSHVLWKMQREKNY